VVRREKGSREKKWMKEKIEVEKKRDGPVGPSFRGMLDFSQANFVFLVLQLVYVPNIFFAPQTP
jgi:hypothetical protein